METREKNRRFCVFHRSRFSSQAGWMPCRTVRANTHPTSDPRERSSVARSLNQFVCVNVDWLQLCTVTEKLIPDGHLKEPKTCQKSVTLSTVSLKHLSNRLLWVVDTENYNQRRGQNRINQTSTVHGRTRDETNNSNSTFIKEMVITILLSKMHYDWKRANEIDQWRWFLERWMVEDIAGSLFRL